MTYKIDGVALPLEPTTGKWVKRKARGFDGGGHPVYSAPREFELSWNLINRSDVSELQDWYDTVANTGTVVVDLPKYRSSTWEFYSYSGVTLGEPEGGDFFEEHETSVTLLIYGIRT